MLNEKLRDKLKEGKTDKKVATIYTNSFLRELNKVIRYLIKWFLRKAIYKNSRRMRRWMI
ncbi:hypothetical protein [Fervidobacterium sp.]